MSPTALIGVGGLSGGLAGRCRPKAALCRRRVSSLRCSGSPRVADVGVIGAGPAGLTLAGALIDRGYSVRLFERLDALRFKARRDITTISGATFQATSPTLGRQVRAAGQAIKKLRLSPSLENPSDEGGPPASDTIVFRHGDLIDVLHRALPDDVVSFEHELQRFEQLDDGQGVQLHFAKGEGEEYCCTVGILVDASGVRSPVRQQLVGDEPVPCLRAIAGVTPSRVAAAYLGDTYADTLKIFGCGKGASVGVGQVNGNVHWNYGEHRTDGRMFDKQVLLEQLDSSFAYLPEPVKSLIRATPEDDMWTRASFDLPLSWKWGEGDVTLVGDAARSGKVSVGFGIPLAVTDVSNLVQQIDSNGLNRNALRWYEMWRLPQTALLKYSFDTIYGILAPPRGE